MVSHYQTWFSFYTPLVYLSTQPTRNPCVRTASSLSCSDPMIIPLKPEGVFVEWGELGMPGWNLNLEQGAPLQVDGLPAKWDTLRLPVGGPQGWCAQMGGDESVTASVARASAGAYQLRACLRSSRPDHVEGELRALLESTRFTEVHLRA